MPSLVATTSTPARKPFVRTHYVRTNNIYLFLNFNNLIKIKVLIRIQIMFSN